MADLDELLSSTLKQAASPGDPSGVADAIRARVDAGEPGTLAASSTAPGWGGGGVAGWLPWVGVVIIVGLVGGAVGASGLVGSPAHEVAVVGSTSVLDAVVDAGSCPGGPTVRTLSADTRVLAIARSDDSAYLGVRNPDDVATTIWVPASVVVPDDASGIGALPIGDACPTMTVVVPVPVVVAAPVTPGKPANPGTPDTTAPLFGKPSIVVQNCLTTVKISASDNVGVASVSIKLTGANAGTRQMQSVGGGVWRLVLDANAEAVHDGNTTFTMTAKDAAGNSSVPAGISGSLQCLI